MARILLADDELDLLEIFSEILRDHGHDIRTAGDGCLALDAIFEWRPELVILDLDMPCLTGRGVVEELARRQDGEAPHIVLFSGNTRVEQIASELGVAASLVKPVSIARLIEVVDAVLERSRPISTLAALGAGHRIAGH